MTSSRIDKRILVVGAPRSGTTLVQSLLAAHTGVTSFTESHFFSRHFRPLPCAPWALLTKSPVQRLTAFLEENGAPSPLDADLTEGLRKIVPASLLMPFASSRVGRELLQVFDQLALSRGAPVWVEKTPMHLEFIRFIERLGNRGHGMHFVHVVRNGLDVVASLYAASKNWQRAYNLEECARRWNADLSASLARVGSPRDHFVFYEDLTRSPEAELERLLTRLDLDRQPEIFERYGEIASEVVTVDEPWKANVAGGVRRSEGRSGALINADRERVEGLLRHELYDRLYGRLSESAR